MSAAAAASTISDNFKKFSYFSGLKQTVKSDLKQMTGQTLVLPSSSCRGGWASD